VLERSGCGSKNDKYLAEEQLSRKFAEVRVPALLQVLLVQRLVVDQQVLGSSYALQHERLPLSNRRQFNIFFFKL
jgi:hypothetical protein